MHNNDLSTTSITFTSMQVERLRSFKAVTKSGVVYHEELAGPNGMSFLLIREGHTTEDMLKKSVAEIRSDRDVVGPIRVAKVLD